MQSIMTLIQYFLLKLFHCRDTHSIVKPYNVILMNHKPRCLSYQYFLSNRSSYGSVACATRISSIRVGCASMACNTDLVLGVITLSLIL